MIKRMIWAMMTLCAFVAAPMLVGCSDDDDPETVTSDEIGLSKTRSSFLLSDTIYTQTDGWTLSEIGIMHEVDFQADSVTFTPNLTADKPFSYSADWLTVSYDNHRIILSADPFIVGCVYICDHNFTIRLTKGSEQAEVVGSQEFYDDPVLRPNASPKSFSFGAEGGDGVITVNEGTIVYSVYFDGKLKPSSWVKDGKSTFDWLTVEKLSDTQWKVAVAPNDASASRTCVIGFISEYDEYENVTIEQSGKAE
jgi:hypothetical protein